MELLWVISKLLYFNSCTADMDPSGYRFHHSRYDIQGPGPIHIINSVFGWRMVFSKIVGSGWPLCIKLDPDQSCLTLIQKAKKADFL